MKKISNIKGAAMTMAVVVVLALTVGVVSSMREGGTEGLLERGNFTDVKTSSIGLLTASETPHGEIAVRYLEFINDNFCNRFAFSYRELETAAWIVEELLAMGHPMENIVIQEFTPETTPAFDMPSLSAELLLGLRAFATFNGHGFVNLGTRASRLSQNIILTVPGQSEEIIIVGAHYDSVLNSGASDNASGVVLLLESAQRMLGADNYYTIVYVFFGAEEVGVMGAAYYVYSLTEYQHEKIRFMVNADVLLEGTYLFYMAGEYIFCIDGGVGRSGANHITETWDRVAHDIGYQHGIILKPWASGIKATSDHLAFSAFGHTVMFLVGLNKFDGWQYYDADNVMLTYMNMTRVLHSSSDCFHHISQTWPGKIENNMKAFSLFLEAVLLADYQKGR